MLTKEQLALMQGYNDHLLTIQSELFKFKLQTSEYYTLLTKGQEIKLLEQGISQLLTQVSEQETWIGGLLAETKHLSHQLSYWQNEHKQSKLSLQGMKAYQIKL